MVSFSPFPRGTCALLFILSYLVLENGIPQLLQHIKFIILHNINYIYQKIIEISSINPWMTYVL